MCKVYTGYCGTNEIVHDLCARTVDNPLAKARGLSLSVQAHKPGSISHLLVSVKCLQNNPNMNQKLQKSLIPSQVQTFHIKF